MSSALPEIFKQMLLSYDPASMPEESRQQMANILKTRGEYLRSAAEIADLRARIWSGEQGLNDITELKGASLTNIRALYIEQVITLLKDSVDLEGIMALMPMIIGGLLQSFKVPIPVMFEAIGSDVDQLKILVEGIQGLLEDL